jgi:hypothetical protein
MIDPKLFTVEELLEEFLDDSHGNRNVWRQHATIVPDYMFPYPRVGERPICVVKHKNSFLRYSKGPRQGYFWDCYGDDFHSPAVAFAALLQAPVPPSILQGAAWVE